MAGSAFCATRSSPRANPREGHLAAAPGRAIGARIRRDADPAAGSGRGTPRPRRVIINVGVIGVELTLEARVPEVIAPIDGLTDGSVIAHVSCTAGGPAQLLAQVDPPLDGRTAALCHGIFEHFTRPPEIQSRMRLVSQGRSSS